jgi:hypothetical protein
MMHPEAENWSGGQWQPETQSEWCTFRLRTEVGADGNQRPSQDDASWGWELKWGPMATRDPVRMVMYLEAENWSGGWLQPETQSGWSILRLRTEVGLMATRDPVRMMMYLEAENWSGGRLQPETQSWGWELKWGPMATRDSIRMMRLEAENWSGGQWQPETQSGWCILRLRTEVGADDNQSLSKVEIWVWKKKKGTHSTTDIFENLVVPYMILITVNL